MKTQKETKQKKDYGYYCDLCGNKICKYQLDFRVCGGHHIALAHKSTNKQEIEYAEICHDCAKEVMETLIDTI